MVGDDIGEIEQNLGILIDAELEIQHRLEGHQRRLQQCPLCRVRIKGT